MRTTTIGGIWNATMDFLKANWLITLAMLIAAVVVSGILFYLLMGSMMNPAMMADPSAVFAMFGKMMLFGVLMLTLFLGTGLSIYRHAHTNGQDSIGSNIGWAMLGGLLLTLVYIVAFVVLYFVLGLIMVAVIGGTASSMQAGVMPGAGFGAGMIIFGLVFYLFLIWLTCRLMVTAPSMAADRDANPFTGIAKSWKMTGPSQWTIFGFYILLLIGTIIVFMILGMIMNALGSVGAILMLIPYLAFWLFMFSLPAGVYREIAPEANAAEVFN